MPVLEYPGRSAPAAPPVALDLPDGWAALPPEHALLRAGGPGAAGDPVEVAVSRHVGAEGLSADALVAAHAAAAAAPRGGEVEDAFVVELGGREWVARNVSWAEDGIPVVEVHLATATGAGEGLAGFVHAVGRVRGAGLDTDYDTLQGTLETLVVDGGAA